MCEESVSYVCECVCECVWVEMPRSAVLQVVSEGQSVPRCCVGSSGPDRPAPGLAPRHWGSESRRAPGVQWHLLRQELCSCTLWIFLVKCVCLCVHVRVCGCVGVCVCGCVVGVCVSAGV